MPRQNKKYDRFNVYGIRAQKNGFVRSVLIILIALLPVMAYFQYKWLRQLSDAEIVRTRTNLKISADRFSQDFDMHLTQIYQTFQIDENETERAGIVSKLFTRYRKMTGDPASENLIDAIYILTLNMEKPADFRRIDLDTGDAKKTDWPGALTFLKKAIRPKDPENFLHLLQFTQAPRLADRPVIITGSAPPVLFDSRNPNDFYLIIIMLNPRFLKEILIPSLVKTNFGPPEDLEYDLAIARKGDPDTLFYTSDSALSAADFSGVEVHADLGRWRMRGIFIATAVTEKTQIDAQHLVSRGKNTEISLKVITNDSTDQKDFSRYFITKVPGWELLVRHRTGSLQAAVAATHRRNLIISYGILALLGISIVLVYMSAQRARRLAARQLEFVSNVSHELRTPLSVIRSAAENLADGVVRDPEQTNQYGRLIRDEGIRLTELVEQVLLFGGINNGRHTVDRQLCDINRLVEQTLDEIDTGRSEISLRLADNIPDLICDRGGMMIALKNIISNAVKYSGEKPEIGISTTCDNSTRKIRISISDNGMGIASEDIEHIFEPFYRSHSAVEAQIHGTGLGLSLAKKIVELHEGSITVKSDPGKGSVFQILLPLKKGKS